MEHNNWPSWKNFLARWGLISPASILLGFNASLIPIAAQFMFLGMPIFKSAALGASYGALIEMLGDEDQLRQFSDYLLGGEA
jgi:hypothetical protein